MKKVSALLLVVVLILSLTACASGTQPPAGTTASPTGTTPPAGTTAPPATAPKAPAVKIQLSLGNNIDDSQGQGCLEWKRIAEADGTNVTVEVFPSNQLGANADVTEQILMGEPLFLMTDGGFLCEYGAPELGIMSMPYVYNTWDDCWKLIETDWFSQQKALLADKGIHVVAANWIAGTRQIVCNRAIHSLADMKGLKLRVPNNALSVAYFTALGAAATPMSLSEVYTAVQQGLIDGQENPLQYLYTAGYYEVCDYLILSSHVMLPAQWICSEKFWQSLSPEQQETITKAAVAGGLYNNEEYIKAESSFVDMFKQKGTKVIEIDDATVQSFKEAVQPVFTDPKITKGWSDGLLAKIQGLMK